MLMHVVGTGEEEGSPIATDAGADKQFRAYPKNEIGAGKFCIGKRYSKVVGNSRPICWYFVVF